MKKLLSIILSFSFVLIVSTAWAATNWPAKAIEEINPAAPGGDTDLFGRLFNRYMEKELGKSVITINMPGGSGVISVSEVNNSEPNGYRLLTYHNGFILNSIFGLTNLEIEDFEIASIPLASSMQCWVVPKNAPYNTAKELVDYMKSGKSVNCSVMTGGFNHLQMLAFEKAGGIKFDMVDTGTTAEKIASMLGGHIDVMSSAYAPIKDFIANGDLKCIGIMNKERHPALPNVSTFIEQGLNVQMTAFFFHAFPKNTPKEIVKKYSDASLKICKDPNFIKELDSYYGTVMGMGAEEATEYMKKIREQYKELTKDPQ
jgi:tripartite-type tricarboxylate transporter receptor subunit TctC